MIRKLHMILLLQFFKKFFSFIFQFSFFCCFCIFVGHFLKTDFLICCPKTLTFEIVAVFTIAIAIAIACKIAIASQQVPHQHFSRLSFSFFVGSSSSFCFCCFSCIRPFHFMVPFFGVFFNLTQIITSQFKYKKKDFLTFSLSYVHTQVQH